MIILRGYNVEQGFKTYKGNDGKDYFTYKSKTNKDYDGLKIYEGYGYPPYVKENDFKLASGNFKIVHRFTDGIIIKQ